MSRRFFVVLVVCLALVGLMVSCKNDIEINDEFGQELVSVTFAEASGASRGLSASLEDFEHNIENYYWGYAAKKSDRDHSEMRRGETPNYATAVVWLNVLNSEPAPGLPSNPIPGFSQGYWDFRLCAYKKVNVGTVSDPVYDYVLVYQGETKEFLLKSSSTNETGNNLVTVTVNPVSSSGNGTLIIKTTGTDAIKLNKVDEASTYGTNYFPRIISVESMTTFPVEYVDTDAEKTKATCGADGVFSLPAGTYKVTFAFADSASAPTVNYAKGTIVATVYSNLETTIKGDLSEMTTSVIIQPELNPELVTYTAVSDYIEPQDPTTTVTLSSTGVARKVEAKTTAAVTNTIIDDMAATSGTTTGYDQKLKLNLNVETVEATETTATYEIGMTATLTSTSTTVPTDVKTSTSDVSSVAKYVTVTLGIQEGLTEVQAYHDGIAMVDLQGFSLGDGWTVSASVVNDSISVKKVKEGQSDVDITDALDSELGPKDTDNKGFFFYDSTGVVVFITKSFSPYSLSFVKPLPAAFVAEVGGFKYTKLENAIKKAGTSSTVTLLKNITLESAVDFNVQGGILDLAGYTITGNVTASEYGATVKNGSITGTLTSAGNSALIKDLTVTGKISVGGTGAVLEECTVTATGDYAVEVTAGKATIKSGTYKASASGKILNGSILVEDGNFKGTLTDSSSVSLIGGVYEYDVKAFVADGYECAKVSEGVYKVRKIYEAENTTTKTKYYYLQDAIDAASAGDTVKLLRNVNAGKTITVAEGKNVTLLMDGNSISSSVSTVILNNGTLTIDGRATESALSTSAFEILRNEGTAILKGGSYTQTGVDGYAIVNHGTMTIGEVIEGVPANGIVLDSQDGGIESRYAETRYTDTVLAVNDGSFTAYNKHAGGAGNVKYRCVVYVRESEATFNGGAFVYAGPNSAGDVIKVKNALVTINGGSFTAANTPIVSYQSYSKAIKADDASSRIVVNGGELSGSLGGSGQIEIHGGTHNVKFIQAGSNWLIDGGTFNYTPGEGASDRYVYDTLKVFVPVGYEIIENASTWTVEEITPQTGVASITRNNKTLYFTTLQKALYAAASGETIDIIKDFEITSSVSVTKAITIDGHNHLITNNVPAGNYAISIPDSSEQIAVSIANLTINATTEDVRGINVNNNITFTLSDSSISTVWANCVRIGGSNTTVATLNNVTATTGVVDPPSDIFAWQRTAVGMCYGATVNINGGQYIGPNAAFIWNSGATLNVNSGSFGTNLTPEQVAGYTYTTYLGNAIAAEGGYTAATYAHVVISGGTFTSPLHAIQNNSSNHFDISGGTFTNFKLYSYYIESNVDQSEFLITGGTYDKNPEDYHVVAAGYEATEVSEGIYTVDVEKLAQLVRTGEKFTSLQAAIDAATVADDEVKLLKDIKLSATATVGAGQKMTLILDGHSITESTSLSGLRLFINDGDLTVVGDENSSVSSKGQLFYNQNDGKLTIDGGNYSRTNATEAYAISNAGASATIRNAVITSSSGGIYSSSVLILEGSNIVTAAGDGYRNCVYVAGTGTINGGSYTYNGTTASGNVIQAAAGACVTINGGSFTAANQNISSYQSYVKALSAEPSGSQIIVNGGTFIGSLGRFGKLDIRGGIFSDVKFVQNSPSTVADRWVITGGTFNYTPSDPGSETNHVYNHLNQYIADGYYASDNGDGTWTVKEITEDEADAMIVRNEEPVYFLTLKDAVAAAADSEEVVLLKSVTVVQFIPITKNLSLNLNGNTIINNVAYNRLFRVSGVTFTIDGKGGRMIIPDEDLPDYEGAYFYESFGFVDLRNQSGIGDSNAKLIVKDTTFYGTTISGSLFAFRASGQSMSFTDVNVTVPNGNGKYYTNGQSSGTNGLTTSIVNGHNFEVELTIKGGEYNYDTRGSGYFAFQAGYKEKPSTSTSVTITDATVTSNTGVLESHGEVSYENCTFKNDGKGSIYYNAAVAAANSGHLTVDDCSYSGQYGVYVYNSGARIDITGGFFKGTVDAVHLDATTGAESIVNITDGNFDGRITVYIDSTGRSTLNISGGIFANCQFNKNSSANALISITGGIFSTDPSAYVASGFTASQISGGQYDGWWEVYAVASVTHVGTVTYFNSLQGAIDAATDGDTVDLLRDIAINTLLSTGATERSITINGNNHTIDSTYGGADGSWCALKIGNKDENQELGVIINNLTINMKGNDYDECIDIIGAKTKVTLNNVIAKCFNIPAYGIQYAIRVYNGGSGTEVNLSNCLLDAQNGTEEGAGICVQGGAAGCSVVLNQTNIATNDYAVLLISPAIVTISGGKLAGWAGVYVSPKASNSTISATETEFYHYNPHSGDSNSFACINLRPSNTTATFTDCKFIGSYTDDPDARQRVFAIGDEGGDVSSITINVCGKNTEFEKGIEGPHTPYLIYCDSSMGTDSTSRRLIFDSDAKAAYDSAAESGKIDIESSYEWSNTSGKWYVTTK